MNRIDYLGVSFAVVCAVFCCFGFSRIQSNTEDVLQWLPDQSEARADYDFFESKFGSDDFLIVTWEDCRLGDERLGRFTEYLRRQDSTGLLQKVTDGTEIFERLARDSDFSKREIISRLRGVFFGADDPDLTCALIELSDLGTADRTASMNLVWAAIDADSELNREQVVMGGYPYIATFIDGQLKNSFRYLLLPSIILSTLISLFCLRNGMLTLIVFIAAVGAAATSIAFIPICNTKYGGLMSIIPALVFVLATSGSIHLIRYGLEAIGDARKLLSIGWRPCVVSAATTAVGMLSLMRSDFPAIRNFGLFCATGVGFAMLFQLILVPCLLARFGTKGLHALAARNETASFWTSLMIWVQRQRLGLAIAFSLIVLAGLLGLTRLKAEVEVEKLFRPESEILVSIGNLENQLGPLDQTELLVVFEQPAADSFPDRVSLVKQIQSKVAQLDDVHVIYSLINFLPKEPSKKTARSMFKRSAYRSILRRERENLANGNLLHVDDTSETWRISLRFPFVQKANFDRLMTEVEATAEQVVASSDTGLLAGGNRGGAEIDKERLGESDVRPELIYTGKTHLFQHAQISLLADLFQNFLLAFVIITPILILVLRSVPLGLIAMLPNVFPTLLVFGGLGWIGIPVDLAIAMTACVALGIAVDDTTHFLIRFRDFNGQLGNVVDPIMHTIAQCGPAMLHTTLIGSAGLLVYYFSDMLVVSRFAWAISTLLVIALLADVLMLPAMLFLFSKSKIVKPGGEAVNDAVSVDLDGQQATDSD
ncbi:MAG: efflux RND transporter permease subunit [Mariniblastus sp.]